jgi:hypothetical protein
MPQIEQKEGIYCVDVEYQQPMLTKAPVPDSVGSDLLTVKLKFQANQLSVGRNRVFPLYEMAVLHLMGTHGEVNRDYHSAGRFNILNFSEHMNISSTGSILFGLEPIATLYQTITDGTVFLLKDEYNIMRDVMTEVESSHTSFRITKISEGSIEAFIQIGIQNLPWLIGVTAGLVAGPSLVLKFVKDSVDLKKSLVDLNTSEIERDIKAMKHEQAWHELEDAKRRANQPQSNPDSIKEAVESAIQAAYIQGFLDHRKLVLDKYLREIYKDGIGEMTEIVIILGDGVSVGIPSLAELEGALDVIPRTMLAEHFQRVARFLRDSSLDKDKLD